MKVIRGERNYRELRKALRDISTQSLVMDNIGYKTPEDVLIRSWGHLLGNDFTRKDAAKFLVKHVEGAFPGTIDGEGSTKYKDPNEEDMVYDLYKDDEQVVKEEKEWVHPIYGGKSIFR